VAELERVEAATLDRLPLRLGQAEDALGEVAVAAAAVERERAVAQPPQRHRRRRRDRRQRRQRLDGAATLAEQRQLLAHRARCRYGRRDVDGAVRGNLPLLG